MLSYKIIYEWTSDGNIHTIWYPFVPGEVYFVRELDAPEGYILTGDVKLATILITSNKRSGCEFDDEATGEYVISPMVEMFDEENVGSLVITKSIDGLNVTDEEKAGALT